MSDFMNNNHLVNNFSDGKYRSAKRVNFITHSAKDHISNEAYKTLRANLFFCGSNMRVILVTSCMENDGKSTVSIEMAKSLAEYGKRTLLIDADMRKSVLLQKNTRNDETVGLSELLSGMTTQQEAIYRTQNDRFDVLFSGRFPPNPVELIGSGAFAELLAELRTRYDYIIVDSPPLGAVIDAAVLATFCDGAILVVNNKRTPRSVANEVKQQLDKSGCKLLGAVLNNTQKGMEYRKKHEYYISEYVEK